MNKIFIDTGAWFALNNKDDVNHDHILRFFKERRGDVFFVTSDYVIDEAITLTRARINHYAASQLAQDLLSEKAAKITYVAPEYLPRALEIFKECSDQDFSFTDCTSFAVMESMKIFESLAFDSHFTFEKFGFTQVR